MPVNCNIGYSKQCFTCLLAEQCLKLNPLPSELLFRVFHFNPEGTLLSDNGMIFGQLYPSAPGVSRPNESILNIWNARLSGKYDPEYIGTWKLVPDRSYAELYARTRCAEGWRAFHGLTLEFNGFNRLVMINGYPEKLAGVVMDYIKNQVIKLLNGE